MFQNTDWGTLLPLACGLLCVLPLLITVISGWLLFRAGKQWVYDFLTPDPQRLEAELVRLRQRYPREGTTQIVNRMIGKQAFRGGMIGAITSIGGFITLPIALPVDILATLRIQGHLVHQIGMIYGHTDSSAIERQVTTYLITTGSSEITESAITFMTRISVRVAGETFAKFIPLFGALIGFTVNYVMVQAIGRTSARWYSLHQPGLKTAAP
ncbi:MAG: EcsC family protein [Anaerolineae bacterium]|nr:EcsC family protein [Anaerolineae bacterium]